jgi:hypothetical protein
VAQQQDDTHAMKMALRTNAIRNVERCAERNAAQRFIRFSRKPNEPQKCRAGHAECMFAHSIVKTSRLSIPVQDFPDYPYRSINCVIVIA